MRVFHHANYLEETSNIPGEREWQEKQMKGWYPQYYDGEVFKKSCTFILINTDESDEIVGCIGLAKNAAADDSDCQVDELDEIWMRDFYVAKSQRGKGIGSKLIEFALSLNKVLSFSKVKLETLANHSEESIGDNLMGGARRLYEKNGFRLYRTERFRFGDVSEADSVWFELKIDD